MKLDDLLKALEADSNPNPAVEVSIMDKARAKIKEERANRILGVAAKNLEGIDDAKRIALDTVRIHRKQAADSLKRLKDITRAGDYAEKTGNFIPFLYMSGGIRAVQRVCQELQVDQVPLGSPLLQVPETFVSESPAV